MRRSPALLGWASSFAASAEEHAFLDPAVRKPPRWFGRLIQDKEDQSGLRHVRNRYYDAATGQFTQEDLIGCRTCHSAGAPTVSAEVCSIRADASAVRALYSSPHVLGRLP
jgi:hypothetical protein